MMLIQVSNTDRNPIGQIVTFVTPYSIHVKYWAVII